VIAAATFYDVVMLIQITAVVSAFGATAMLCA
jgi:hypothetical protein